MKKNHLPFAKFDFSCMRIKKKKKKMGNVEPMKNESKIFIQWKRAKDKQ